eukprot:gene20672-31854_t
MPDGDLQGGLELRGDCNLTEVYATGTLYRENRLFAYGEGDTYNTTNKMFRGMLMLSVAVAAAAHGTYGRYRYNLPGDAGWPGQWQWDKLARDLQGGLELRGDYNLTEVRSLRAAAADVRQLLLFARRHRLRVAVMSTGRNTADDALLIHMAGMRGVAVNTDEPSVTTEGGALFSDMVAVRVASNGTLVALHGTVETMYGYAVDAILRATVVTADGVIVTATPDNEHKDLLFAIKGGGGPAFDV